MFVLIAYDVSTIDDNGRRRLRRVARMCEDWGQRVQNSVFECKLDPAQFEELRKRLVDTIDPEADSLRFYHLPSKWRHRVEHVGAKPSKDLDGPLLA
jgi:CRISPR-associated endonuclease Cas2